MENVLHAKDKNYGGATLADTAQRLST
jgi:hypothetical protein